MSEILEFPSHESSKKLEAILNKIENLLHHSAVKPLIVDAEGLAKLFSCSKRHIARMKSAGELPPSVTLGGGSKIGWLMADVELFLSARCDMTAFEAMKRRR